MSNLNDLFAMPDSLKDMTTEPPKKKKDENIYSCDPKEGKDNVYKAKIRFLLNLSNKNESIIATHYHWLTDANGENPIYVIDPSSVGEPSPIGDLFWKFKKSSNAAEQVMADKLSRKTKYYSLVQIVEDEQHPELEGKIKVFAFGAKIKSKIEEEESDKDDGGNPFNILSARNFKLEVKVVGGYTNYDSCRFVGSKTAISINGKSIAEDKDATRILEYFKTAPSLDDYKYKPWTAEMTEKVNKNLSTYTKGFTPTVIESAMKQDKDEDVSTPVQTTIYNGEEDEDDFLDGINI
jgi:hypothetical protein